MIEEKYIDVEIHLASTDLEKTLIRRILGLALETGYTHVRDKRVDDVTIEYLLIADGHTFIGDVMGGIATMEQLDDYVDAWHVGHYDGDLSDFLGLTWDQYEDYVQNGVGIFNRILMDRLPGVSTRVRPSDTIEDLDNVDDDTLTVDWEKLTQCIMETGYVFPNSVLKMDSFRQSTPTGMMELYDEQVDVPTGVGHHPLVGYYIIQTSGQGSYLAWCERQPTDPEFLL